VKWRSPAYFEYFRSFFKDYLYSLSLEEKGKRINHAINISGNLQVLDSAFIQADEFKPNDTLRMLILLNGLGEIYFRKGFEKNKVERIIEQIKLRAPHPAISVMAANMLEKCWLLGRGASLPKLNLERSTGGYTSTDSLREKLTLLAFWTTWNLESMQDMLMLQKLNQKYGNSIRFISVLTDGDREKAQNWKKEKKLNWEFLYDEKNKSVQEKWHILKVPHYLLLDEDGDILRFDAPAPDENLELLLKNELKTRKR
jgi:thiol-disulfide isomerase/thioredoxin